MAIDRNLLEQEALALLNRGQVDKALNRYQALLRADPRDRRIRQKVAELLLKLGRRAEGDRMLREVADSYVNEGQHRAAVSVLKQLVELNPEDAELEGQLGGCYQAAGFPTEARRALESAVRRLSKTDPGRAVTWLRVLIRVSGGEPQLQVQLAELLDAAGQRAEALDAWRTLAQDAKRRGRSDDVLRFLELALKASPDDVDLLCDAAEARFANNDPKGALVHVQRAYQSEKQSARVLGLLARALEEGGMQAKARPIWIQAARQYEADGNAAGRADALAHALALGDDPELRAQLGEASKAASRSTLRLDEKPWAAPRSDPEVKAVIRARTLARYGFGERAVDLLRATELAVRSTISVRIALAELLAERGDPEGALAELEALPTVTDATALGDIRTRIRQLGGGPPIEEPGVDTLPELGPEALEPAALDPMDEIVDDEPTEDTPVPSTLIVKTIKAARPSPATPSPSVGIKVPVKKAARPARRDDDDSPAPPSEPETVIMMGPMTDLSAFLNNADEAVTVADVPAFFEAMEIKPDFSDLFPPTPSVEIDEDDEEEPTATNAGPATATLEEASALISVGLFADARDRLKDRNDLPAVVLLATALKGLGDANAAAERLRSAVSDASESDEGYLDALWLLAQIDAAGRKTRSALRLLGEIQDLDPQYRAAEVGALKRGVELLVKRPS